MLKLFKTVENQKGGKGSVANLRSGEKIIICPEMRPGTYFMFDNSTNMSSALYNQSIGVHNYNTLENCIIFNQGKGCNSVPKDFYINDFKIFQKMLDDMANEYLLGTSVNKCEGVINKVKISDNISFIELVVSKLNSSFNRMTKAFVKCNPKCIDAGYAELNTSYFMYGEDNINRTRLHSRIYEKKYVLYGLDVKFKNANKGNKLFLSSKRHPRMRNESFAKELIECEFDDFNSFYQYLAFSIGTDIMFLDNKKEYNIKACESNLREIAFEIWKIAYNLKTIDELANILTPKEAEMLEETLRKKDC